MEKELDELLRHALTPTEQPDFWLNQRILNQVKEQKSMKRKTMRRLPAAALAAALLLGAGSLTAFAAWKYLAPEDVAEDVMHDKKLAEAFLTDAAIVVNETQSYGGYNVTLLGIISGSELSSYSGNSKDRTHVVVAIENADGTPMIQEETDIFVSPLIRGYHPSFYNAASMGGGYSEKVEDGVLYRIVECDTVEIYSDRDIYLCVNDGTFYEPKAYCYDSETGVISRNEEYNGLNALFDLNLDASKADPERGKEYMEDIYDNDDLGMREKDVKVELEEPFVVESAEGNEKGAQAAEYALQFLGNPYEWGGDSLTEGTDSSGFTMGVYEQFGVTLPHNSTGQRKIGYEIEGLENAQPGDLVFYDNPKHVAIYIGDGKVVHAAGLENGICISEADFGEIAMIRRMFETE